MTFISARRRRHYPKEQHMEDGRKLDARHILEQAVEVRDGNAVSWTPDELISVAIATAEVAQAEALTRIANTLESVVGLTGEIQTYGQASPQNPMFRVG